MERSQNTGSRSMPDSNQHQERREELRPCDGCGFMIRGGSTCGDCREYGPPKGWRWQYLEKTGRHVRVNV